MVQIFISYSSKDKSFSRQLAANLDQVGGDVWIDQDDIRVGRKWSAAIQQGLDECKVMIVIISPPAMESTNVEDEWQYFLDQHKPVVPILYRPAKIHFQLNRLQYVDFHAQDYGTAFAQLHAELQQLGIALTPLDPNAVRVPLAVPGRSGRKLSRYALRMMVLMLAGILLLALIFVLVDYWPGATNQPETQNPEVQVETLIASRDQTSTATLWTQTPTSTPPTPSATPSQTPTATPTATPKPTMIPAGSNNGDWTPMIRRFEDVNMVLVPPGCFRMGSNRAEDTSPVHEVCFDDPFWIDQSEVWQAQLTELAGEQANPSHFTSDDGPVEHITWLEAQAFCERRGGHLPTEAQWEYAARGPQGWSYPWGDDFIEPYVVYAGNSGGQPAPVEPRTTSSWVGAWDMSGNVAEWVADWYGPYDGGWQINPEGARDGEFRVIRGGSYQNYDDALRTTYRFKDYQVGREKLVGFRCARPYEGAWPPAAQ